MNSKCLVIAVAAVALTSIVGVGFAVVTYTATTVSSDNTVDYIGHTVDVVDSNGAPIQSSLLIAGPTVSGSGTENEIIVSASTTTISGYKVRVNADQGEELYVRCWVLLDDARSWVIIDNITLTITISENETRTVNFLASGVSSVPSDSILLAAGSYSFTFAITYSAKTLLLAEDEDVGFLNLSGSKLVFMVGDTDPLSVQSSP